MLKGLKESSLNKPIIEDYNVMTQVLEKGKIWKLQLFVKKHFTEFVINTWIFTNMNDCRNKRIHAVGVACLIYPPIYNFGNWVD